MMFKKIGFCLLIGLSLMLSLPVRAMKSQGMQPTPAFFAAIEKYKKDHWGDWVNKVWEFIRVPYALIPGLLAYTLIPFLAEASRFSGNERMARLVDMLSGNAYQVITGLLLGFGGVYEFIKLNKAIQLDKIFEFRKAAFTGEEGKQNWKAIKGVLGYALKDKSSQKKKN